MVLGKMGLEDFGELFDRLRQLGCCLLSVYEDLEAFVVPAPSVSSQAYSYSALQEPNSRFPSLQKGIRSIPYHKTVSWAAPYMSILVFIGSLRSLSAMASVFVRRSSTNLDNVVSTCAAHSPGCRWRMDSARMHEAHPRFVFRDQCLHRT